jgi:hypothetical protein
MKTKFNSIFLVVYMLCSFMLGNTTALAQAESNEIFDSFLLKFDSDKNFQVSRVNFPVMFIGLDDEYFKPDTSYIKKGDWKLIELFSEEQVALNVRNQIYDNFDLELEDTGERVFSTYTIVGGMNIHFYFKRINGKWFLVKIQDLST